MASKLPATQDVTLAIPGVQSSLFGSPLELLEVDDAELRRVAALVGHEAGSVLAQVRRFAGLVAWAAWYRMDEKGYREFAAGMATDLGIEVETLRKWRRSVVTREKLPVPGVAGQRADAAAKGRKTAGQPGGAVRTSATAAPIPVPSTEAPANQSEGVAQTGETPAEPSRGAPSDPSSGGARATAPPPRRDAPTEVPPASRPAPPGPNPTGPVPSLRQEASAAFRALHDATEGIGEKWTAEEATYWENRSKREVDAWRAAHGIASAPPAKPQRRQGTITRPQAAVLAGRAIEQLNGTAGRPSTRVTIPTIPAPKLAKRHADDCRCLSCVPPKAVAK